MTNKAEPKCQAAVKKVQPMPGQCFERKPETAFTPKKMVEASIQPEQCETENH